MGLVEIIETKSNLDFQIEKSIIVIFDEKKHSLITPTKSDIIYEQSSNIHNDDNSTIFVDFQNVAFHSKTFGITRILGVPLF